MTVTNVELETTIIIVQDMIESRVHPCMHAWGGHYQTACAAVIYFELFARKL